MIARRLRIGYTCHDAFPSTHTNTQQIFWTLSEMARLGHTVDVCVPAVAGGAAADAAIARHYGEQGGGPPALRFLPMSTHEARGSLAKGWFDLRAPFHHARGHHDLIWTRDPFALVAAVRTGVPTIFETYRPDFATASAFAPWRHVALGAGSFAGVIAHSALAADALVDAGVPRPQVLVAHNGCAPSLMQPVLDRAEARALTGLPGDRPLLVYTGHVGPQKGTDALIALAAGLPQARLVIVGVDPASGDGRWIDDRARQAGATNIVLRPRVDVAAVAPYLYAADCLVIPPTDEPLRRYGRTVLPMKVFSYLAAARPIVAPALPDIAEVLMHDETAVLVPPGDAKVAATMVADLLADEPRAARLAKAAAGLSHRYTWRARAERISSWLLGLEPIARASAVRGSAVSPPVR